MDESILFYFYTTSQLTSCIHRSTRNIRFWCKANCQPQLTLMPKTYPQRFLRSVGCQLPVVLRKSVVSWMSIVSCQLSVGVVASDPLQIASGLVMLWTSASVRRVSDFIWHLTCINWHPVCYKQQASPTGITNRQANWPQRLATTQSSEIHLGFVLSE